MRLIKLTMLAALLAISGPAGATTLPLSESPIAGTWEGKVDNLPVLSITVKDNGGALSGTVTFYMIRDDGDGPRVEGKDTKPLVNPKLDGSAFSFQTKGRNDAMLSFKMELTGKNEATITLKRMINGESEEMPVKMTREQSAVQPPPDKTGPSYRSESDALASIEDLVRDAAARDGLRERCWSLG